MPPSSRQVNQSILPQGSDERIQYAYLWSNIGTPTSGSVTLYEMDTNPHTDVSGSCLTGSPVIVDYALTTPTVHSLTPGIRYRLVCTVSIGADIYSSYVDLIGESP